MTISSGNTECSRTGTESSPFSFFVWQLRRERTIPHADKNQTRGMNPVLRIHSEDAPPESGPVWISTSSVRLGESPVLNLKMPCDPSVGTDNGVCIRNQHKYMYSIVLSGQRRGNAMYHVAPESQRICRAVMYEIGHKGRQI